MTSNDRDPKGVAQAAELAIDDGNWSRLEDAAHELLGIARKRKTEGSDAD